MSEVKGCHEYSRKPVKPKRSYTVNKEPLQQKVARLQRKWGIARTKAEQIEDEMYAQDFGDG